MAELKPETHLEKYIAGELEPVTHLEKVIAQYGGGGDVLPPVTAEDDGDVLGVVGGKWAKTTIPSPSAPGVVYIDGYFNSQIEAIENPSMTPEEALAAAATGSELVFRLDTDPSSAHSYMYVPISALTAPYGITFSRILWIGDALKYIEISGGSVEWTVATTPIGQA